MAKAIVFLVLLLISPAAYAVDLTVGGSNGWNPNTDYVAWAAGQTFTTSDSLVFNFDPSHAVDEVSQADFQSCNGANPISSSTSSPTTISLDTPGTRYFICPRSNHCSRGQRLAVVVTAAGTTPSPPSPTPPTGTTPSPPSPTPPTGTTPSPPSGTPPTPGTPTVTNPPRDSAASGILSGKNSLIVGFSLALAALV